ncbi:MAG TPA: response regulator [Chitinophagaceae bacterium]
MYRDAPLKLLVVEDNPTDFLLLHEYIELSRISVESIHKANNLHDAIELLSLHPFSIIFLDLFLPDSNGLETFAQLNAINPTVPIIILSGLSDSEIAINAIQAGAQDYILKGEFDDKILHKTIHYSIERKKLQDKLIDQQLKYQQQITEITIQAQEKEREELGKELHDNINQLLATSKMCIDIARKNEAIREECLSRSHENLRIAIEEIRVLCKQLVAPSIVDLGLAEAVNDLISGMKFSNKIEFHFTATGIDKETTETHKQLMIYRVIQEQINNILKYAKASEVTIEIKLVDKTLMLKIADNGIGFDTSKKMNGIGLRNIKSRVQLYNGHLNIWSEPGQGCMLNISIPV